MTETKTRTRTCDQCGADLTSTDAAYGWHFVLSGEFTPSCSRIGYDPHPNPPKDKHFCDSECLARWAGVNLDAKVDDRMWHIGGQMLFKYREELAGMTVNSQTVAKEVFEAMWAARRTSIAAKERATKSGEQKHD